MGDGKEVVLGGLIGAIKIASTKKPSRNGHSKYVNFDLEDATGVVRCIMWPEDFAVHGEKVKKDAIVLIRGRTDSKGREPNIIVNKLMTLEQAEKEFTKRLLVKFRRGFHTEADMKRVRDALLRFPGKTPVVVVIDTWQEAGTNGNGHAENGHSPGAATAVATATRTSLKCYLTVPSAVSAGTDLRRELSTLLGSDGFRFEAGSATQTGGGPPPDSY